MSTMSGSLLESISKHLLTYVFQVSGPNLLNENSSIELSYSSHDD